MAKEIKCFYIKKAEIQYSVFKSLVLKEPPPNLGSPGDIFQGSDSQIFLSLQSGWERYLQADILQDLQRHPVHGLYACRQSDLTWLLVTSMRNAKRREYKKAGNQPDTETEVRSRKAGNGSSVRIPMRLILCCMG